MIFGIETYRILLNSNMYFINFLLFYFPRFSVWAFRSSNPSRIRNFFFKWQTERERERSNLNPCSFLIFFWISFVNLPIVFILCCCCIQLNALFSIISEPKSIQCKYTRSARTNVLNNSFHQPFFRKNSIVGTNREIWSRKWHVHGCAVVKGAHKV